MHKNAKCVVALLCAFLFVGTVHAECSYEEQVRLNDLASTVKATYEETEITDGETENYVDPETGLIDTDKQVLVTKKGFIVKILNITNNLYVIVKNDYDNTEKTYYYSDTNNGSVTLSPIIADKVYSYSITIRAINGECSGKELRTINLLTPKYNSFSQLMICQNNPKIEYCQEYVSSNEEISYEKIASAVESKKSNLEDLKQEEKKKSFKEKITEFAKNNLKVIIASIIGVIVIGGITIFIVIKKRCKRLI